MQFDDDFFAGIGLGSASAEEKADFADTLGGIVQNRVTLRVSEALDEAQSEHLSQLLERNDDKAAFAYLAEQYPDYQRVVDEEIKRVKDEMARDVVTVYNQLNPETNDKDS